MASCYSCNNVTVAEEYQRCADCKKTHEALAKELDARPKRVEKKPKEKLYPIKSMRNGIEFTTWYDKTDLQNLGIKIPDDQNQENTKD